MPRKVLAALLVSALMVLSTVVAVGMVPAGGAAGTSAANASTAATNGAASAGTSSPSAAVAPPIAPSAVPPPTCSPPSSQSSSGSPLLSANGDGLVNGRLEPGGQSSGDACIGNNTDPAPAPSGVVYDGATYTSGNAPKDQTIDSNSVAGIQTVYKTTSLFPDSTTPARWGDQLNVVLANVTLFNHRGYDFWVQSLAEYDTSNDTLSFYDATWNFTTSSSNEMTQSILYNWSANSSDYINIWLLGITPYIYCPPPFTLTLYVNSSVTALGDQELWYNYSVLTHGKFYADGSYDWLIFQSQVPNQSIQPLQPAYFEASATTHHVVDEGYEFDTMIGPDTSSNEINFLANETVQVKYCSLPPNNDCTPTNFQFSNVPAAVNFGSQTAEGSIGLSINFIGESAYATAGPFIEHGLWNYTGHAGWNVSGAAPVTNGISVSGSPLAPLATQPYVFVFFENRNFSSQGYQWAPDVPTWYLMPGVYNYELMLADYTQVNGTINVLPTGATLTAVLPYNPSMGVYTPLWVFNNGELAGISSSGTGAISNQYLLFNNPTTSYFGFTPNNLSSLFYLSKNSYTSYAGIILDGTTAYVDANAPPSFCVRSTATACSDYLSIWFFNTTHVTLSNGASIRGWPSPEWTFYISVPGSQNMFPQGDVDVLNSHGDLIMDNNFVAVVKSGGAPDDLYLHGGSGNVIWGNTFRDPPGVALGVTYGGIGEDEGGDLIYNNNFSVDNPVVLVPFNMSNDAECLPQCTGAPGSSFFYNTGLNSWNITPQAASNVKTVNGFSLSGNILGPQFATQGGNYYWNYGTTPNNLTTSPYVSRFYYSDLSQVYPLGCPRYQVVGTPCGTPPPVVGGYENGMPAGSGDYAPYGPTVTFSETGLSLGGSWAINFNGKLTVTSSSSVTFSPTYGTYSYSVAAIGSSLLPTPASGTVLVSGVPVVNVVFAAAPPATYSVYFTASGIFSGTSFSVSFNGGGAVSSGGTSQVIFNSVAAGSYPYVVTAPTGYTLVSSTPSSPLTVSSSSVSVALVFTPTTYTVTFTETGLPSGTVWGLSFGGVFHWGTAGSGASSITFQVAGSVGGTLYNWLIGYIAGYPSSPSSGSTTVFTSNPGTISITFT